ncbi:hypothetical protein SCP_0804820 [Sparassis crispa]|uniref:Cytochrome P450 n=1 Tax=Sparassis crispa TaxID=139825 RepID=A0A401GUQ9_9APHY|nr:hypothetical protein SCP_0804820 [Sparassis crispa]GBE85958.1 hypothetical protein SCP_0804820 [Sparassis crispa]
MQPPYLDTVCREILRVQPLLTILDRLRGLATIRTDTRTQRHDDERDTCPQGHQNIVGVAGSNLSKVLWAEDSLEWKPERWLSPLPSAVTEAHIPGVFSNLMTFIGGGRACIDFKFSEMDMGASLSCVGGLMSPLP